MEVTERELVKSFKVLLTIQKHCGKLTFHRVNTAGTLRGGRRTRNQDTKGFSDFMIISNGNVGFAEMKGPRGILSEDQRSFLEDKKRHGCKVGVLDNMKDAIEFLKQLCRGDLTSVGI